jgi:hypothetical protein
VLEQLLCIVTIAREPRHVQLSSDFQGNRQQRTKAASLLNFDVGIVRMRLPPDASRCILTLQASMDINNRTSSSTASLYFIRDGGSLLGQRDMTCSETLPRQPALATRGERIHIHRVHGSILEARRRTTAAVRSKVAVCRIDS